MLVISQGLLINVAAELAISQLPRPQIQKTSFLLFPKKPKRMDSAFLWIYTPPELAPVLEGLLGTQKRGQLHLAGCSKAFFPSIFSSSTAPALSLMVGITPGQGAQKWLYIPQREGADPPLGWFKDVIWLLITRTIHFSTC